MLIYIIVNFLVGIAQLKFVAIVEFEQKLTIILPFVFVYIFYGIP